MFRYSGSRCQLGNVITTTIGPYQPTCNCFNNGVCGSGGICQCPSPYFGSHCEYYNSNNYPTTTSATPQFQCPAGLCVEGTCAQLPQGGALYYCICNFGWGGSRCNIRNWCLSSSGNLCQNGGTCTSNQYGYSCTCQYGFYGQNCQCN